MKKYFFSLKHLIAYMLLGINCSSYAQYCNDYIVRTAPDSRYKILGDGSEVQDNNTGLIWQRCTVGYKWSGSTCEIVDYSEKNSHRGIAMNEAKRLGDNYRIPNIKELQSLVEEACYSPAINQNIFPMTLPKIYMSSTLSLEYIVFGVNFDSGASSAFKSPSMSGVFRLVRSN